MLVRQNLRVLHAGFPNPGGATLAYPCPVYAKD